MNMALYCHLSELIFIGIIFTHVIFPSVVHATETLNRKAIGKGVADQRDSVPADNNDHAQIILQKRPSCERCLQDGKQKEDETAGTSNHQQRQSKSSLKTDGNARSVTTAARLGINTGKSRTNHDSLVSTNKNQHFEEEAASHAKKARKSNKAHLQTSATTNSAPSGTLLSLATEDKLKRIYDAQRARKDYSHVGKVHSQSKNHVNLKASDNKGHRFEQLSKQKERRFKAYNKNNEDGFNKFTTSDTFLSHPMDAHPGPTKQLTRDSHYENNNLPRIHRINVNIVRKENNNNSGPSTIRNSLQLSNRGMVKYHNQSLLPKDQSKPREDVLQAQSNNNGGTTIVGINTEQTHVQKLGSSKDHEIMKDVSNDDKYFADETRNRPVSAVEWNGDQQMAARRRGELTANRLVRPSAADRLEQRISPDLNKSYRQLMDRIHRILQMFSQSMEQLNSYKAEIFNETRYTIMMGARDVLEELSEASDYIYDGMTSATQFTREVILKYHNSQHAQKTGILQAAPIHVVESEVKKRNFQPQLERTYREQNKAQADIGKVNEMKMKCLQGESRLKQVRNLFLTNYDRPTINDLFGYLNTSILQINRGLKMSPQLRQLRRRKFYLDRVKGVLTTANSLLINSTNGFQKAMRQNKENYDAFKNWLQKEQSIHHGFSRSSKHGLSSYHSEKLQKLVSQATEHVHELSRQNNRLHSILDSPLDAAKKVVTQKGNMAVQVEFKLLTTNLKLLLKDMLTSLNTLRVHIGSKIKLTWAKRCRSEVEGSGLIDTDDEDLCEEEGSGLENSDSERVFTLNNEDFTFVDEPAENASPGVHSFQQLGLDLADFTFKLLHRSRQIYDSAQTLQGPLAGLQQQLDNIESSISSVGRSTDTQKEFIIDFHENARHIQEVKEQIPDISKKIAAVRKLNLEDAVKKAKQAVEKARQLSQADRRPSLETTVSKGKKIYQNKAAERDQMDKMDDDFDYSGLFKEGQEILSNHADITLLRSMAVENCGKIGNRFTYIKSNMSLLRQKVEKAREILTTLQLSVLKSGHGYISVSIPQSHPEMTASLTSSIKACVKPKTLHGALLFVKGNNSASYGVTLDSGNIVVTAFDKENNDLISVTLDQLAITEEWYTLEIQRTGETLSVMAVSQAGNTQTKTAKIVGLDLIQPSPLAAYLGGLPDSLGVTSELWEGCVGNLMVNGRTLTLFNSDSTGIQPSLCTDHCISEKQKLSMVFSGNGFARFIRSERERITSVALKFNTQQKMASLLSVINKRQNFYLSVVMDNGALKIESSSPGEIIVLLSLNSSLNDGHSHLLKVLYRGSKTYPELDGNREAFSVERTSPQIVRDMLDGVLIGALVFHSRQFLTTPYRPLIGCVGDVFINDDRLLLLDAVDIYNTFHGNCNSSDIWHSCWQWTDQSKPLSFGVVDNSNRMSLLVSRDSLGSLIHFTKENMFDIGVTLTSSGIDVSSDNSEGMMIRPTTDKSYFTLITITDGGREVTVTAWDQSVSFTYISFWSFASKDLTKPHTVAIGEPRDAEDRTFTGSISQFIIEDRFYDLGQFGLSHNLTPCERPLEDIQPPPPVADPEEPFSCI